jgi:hypothetical protein
MKTQGSILAHLINIVDSIEADLMLPLRAHERDDRGGFFSISRQVFSYIDYLGALASNGKNSTDNAVAYMEKYFSHVNPAYTGRCNLMYAMWRHGTVHEYDPKVFMSQAHGFRLRWGANNTSVALNRKWHLKCLCRASQPNSYHWFINLFELVDDLRKSVTYFIADLEADHTYLQKAKQNLNKLSAEVDLDNQHKDSLLKEAIKVVGDAAGVIDDQGNVIREFKAAELEAFKKDEWGNRPPS